MKYTTIFSSYIKPLVPEERDKYLAMASLIDIGEFIPDLDTDSNIDLLPIAFNACVINRANKNGDVVDTENAIKMHKNFINKPINIEHNRERVVGTILTAGFSEFGTDKPLTEKEVKEIEGPFNITLGGAIWKIVNSKLADIIENSSDPTSEDYLKVSASWELGFADFDIIITEGNEKNIENGERISDNTSIEEFREFLKGFGGDGTLEDGRNIYRHIVGEIIPLGIGLTESPAADVKGIVTEKEEEEEEIKAENQTQESNEKISHFEENNVIENKDTSIIMKITDIRDITDESLKQLSASAVSDFIEEEIKRVSDQYQADKAEKEEVIKTTSEKFDSVSEELKSVRTDLEKMQQEKAKQEALELFNTRMSEFDGEYELDDEIRANIASDIKDMSEESYASYKKRMASYLKNRKQGLAEKAKAEIEEALEDAKEQGKIEAKQKETEVEATKETTEKEVEEVVEEAVENAEEAKEIVTNTTEASESSLYEKYKDAFSIDQFNVKFFK